MSCHREQSVSVNVEGEKGITYSFYFNDSFVVPGECAAYGVQQYIVIYVMYNMYPCHLCV